MSKAVQSVHRMLLLCGGAAMVLSWLIPNHYPPWVSFYNESGMALALLFLALGMFLTIRSPAMPTVALAPLAVIVIPWLQFAFGLLYYSSDAWVSSLYLLGIAVAICVGYNLAALDARRVATLLSTATLIAAIVSSAIGLNQVLEGTPLGIWSPDMTPDRRAFANLAQPNNLATLLGFGAVALWYLRERGYLEPFPALSILFLLVVGVAATQSRTALLFGPAIALGLWLISRRTKTVFKTSFAVVVTATGVHWLLVWLWPRFLSALLLGVPTSVAERGLHTSRSQIWPLLIDAVNQHPWSGYGWLQVGAAQLAVADRHEPIGELFFQAHNLFLDLVVFCGYPLGCLLGGLIVYWFVSRWIRVRSNEAACGMLVITVLGIHSMLELPHWYAYFLIPAALWIGLVERTAGVQTYCFWKVSVPLIAVSGLLCAAICRDYLKVEDDFRLARFESLRMGQVHATRLALDAPFLSDLATYSRFYRLTPVVGMTDKQLTDICEITKRYPYGRLLYGCAAALELNGRSEEARQTFIKIRYIHSDRIYQILKDELHDRNLGQPGLLTFEQSLPE